MKLSDLITPDIIEKALSILRKEAEEGKSQRTRKRAKSALEKWVRKNKVVSQNSATKSPPGGISRHT